MRHLNKIIFINSANIPYAEISLDGNVHFAGTQGVGKSTALRAILFFYTADKMHLGIQQGQKSFDEFYFPKSNSYIVYEVKTNHGFYSILLSRSQGRTVFRFIDSPYRKEWIINEERKAESDWVRVRERIGNDTDISAKIDTYDLYRNIIFGNTHDRSLRFDKYAIVESNKYHNIPRSIQNVFLNSKLDADFVKNTIINSMTDIEDAIQLSPYRPQVENFEREFDDISCWYAKDKNGEITVRTKADKVVATYRVIMALENEMIQTWRKLNFSVDASSRQIPVLNDSISSIVSEIKGINEKISRIRQDYEKEHESIIAKIGGCDSKLKEIRTKRKHYEEIDIKSIIDSDSRLPLLIHEKEKKEAALKLLRNQFDDITEKYNKLREEIEYERNSFEQLQTGALQQFNEQCQTRRDRFSERRDSIKLSIETAYSEWIAESDSRMDALRNESERSGRRLSELDSWHPKEKEMEEIRNQLTSLRIDESRLTGELKTAEGELAMLRRDAEAQLERIESQFQTGRQNLLKEIAAMEADRDETQKIIDRWSGSLYRWLSDNKPGWEDNIGKVVDEENVLYASNLSPALSSENGFFGIKLDLDAIENRHRTPDEYRLLLKEQIADIEKKNLELKKLAETYNGDVAALNKAFKARISASEQTVANLRYQLSMIPTKRKDYETRLRTIAREEESLKTAERDKRTAMHDAAILNLDKEKNERVSRNARRLKELKKADSDYKAALKDIKNSLDEFRKKQQDEKAERLGDINRRLSDSRRQELDELEGKGADTKAIEQYRNEISDIESDIERINSQKEIIFGYRKDERELFSHEDEFRKDKERLETKKENIANTYHNRRKRHETDRDEKQSALDAAKSRLKDIEDGLRQYDSLCNIERCVPESVAHDEKMLSNNESCHDLVSMMRGAINSRRSKQDELKRSVNSFNSHFRPGNTFSFIQPQFDEDYMAYAVNLKEFVDNNKIEDYRERLSDHYSNILNSIAREVDMLINHSAEIKGIINEINRDFRERNFAGVIRGIELRAEESSDRMMQLLRSIHDFIEEHDLSIGEVNLFSGTNRDSVNIKVVDFLKKFMNQLRKESSRSELNLSSTFTLKFRIQENDNDTGWVERISNVGSDGTDILVKAMVNIMLINVFKTKASRKSGDFIIHCMMDEIGKLHPSNVEGILKFANVRNIYLINSSPMGYNSDIYKYNYLLTKNAKSQTQIKRLVTINMS